MHQKRIDGCPRNISGGSRDVNLVSEHQPVEMVGKVMTCPTITKIGEETNNETKMVRHMSQGLKIM